MRRLVQLGLLAAVLYFGYNTVLPWLQGQLQGDSLNGGNSQEGSASSDEVGRCINAAERANSRVSEGIRNFARPPIDIQRWGDTRNRLESFLQRAESDCFCFEPACDLSSDALGELEDLVDRFDRGFRGKASVPLNAARDLQSIESKLSEARRSIGG